MTATPWTLGSRHEFKEFFVLEDKEPLEQSPLLSINSPFIPLLTKDSSGTSVEGILQPFVSHKLKGTGSYVVLIAMSCIGCLLICIVSAIVCCFYKIDSTQKTPVKKEPGETDRAIMQDKTIQDSEVLESKTEEKVKALFDKENGDEESGVQLTDRSEKEKRKKKHSKKRSKKEDSDSL